VSKTRFSKAVEDGGASLFRLMRSLAVVENGGVRCCGLTTTQGLALLAMKPAGGITMGLVSEALGVAAATATRVIDNLVRDALVVRAENPQDRRNVRVRPTARGEKTIKELDKCYRRFWETIFRDIPESKLPGTLKALELLVQAVERAKSECCATR